MEKFKLKPTMRAVGSTPYTIKLKLNDLPKVMITEEGAEMYTPFEEGQLCYLVNVEKSQNALPWIVALKRQMHEIEVKYDPRSDSSHISSEHTICESMNSFEYEYIR